MKLKFEYGSGVITLPASVIAKSERTTKKDIRLLFLIASEPLCLVDLDAGADAVAKSAGVDRTEVDAAIAFWRGAGVIALDDEAAKPQETNAATEKETEPADKKLRSRDELPQYTSDEIEALLARRADAGKIIDGCQNALGKLFNTMEINTVLGLIDYYGLDGEYLIMLFAHCAEKGKRSLKYIERLTYTLYTEGVESASELEEYFKNLDAFEQNEKKVRELFGMRSRALTSKEKAALKSWFGEWGFDISVVEKAYEITINNIGEPSVNYTSAILERWHSDGYKTLSDVEAGLAEYKKKKDESTPGSFNTDDIFEAALKRSYSK